MQGEKYKKQNFFCQPNQKGCGFHQQGKQESGQAKQVQNDSHQKGENFEPPQDPCVGMKKSVRGQSACYKKVKDILEKGPAIPHLIQPSWDAKEVKQQPQTPTAKKTDEKEPKLMDG